jgi:hypothetical protein
LFNVDEQLPEPPPGDSETKLGAPRLT